MNWAVVLFSICGDVLCVYECSWKLSSVVRTRTYLRTDPRQHADGESCLSKCLVWFESVEFAMIQTFISHTQFLAFLIVFSVSVLYDIADRIDALEIGPSLFTDAEPFCQKLSALFVVPQAYLYSLWYFCI